MPDTRFEGVRLAWFDGSGPSPRQIRSWTDRIFHAESVRIRIGLKR